jgi:acyl carrier protein
MTEDQVKKIVVDIINEIAPDEDTTGLKDEINLRDQMDLDSMDFLDIVMELRKQHGIEVPEAEYPQLASLASCGTYLTPLFNAK